MSRRLRTLVVGGVVPVSILASILGCGAEPTDRLPVSGEVAFRGQPLSTGTIEFTAPQGVPQTGAVVNSGRYEIPANHGLPPGEYIVRISSIEEAAPASDLPPGPRTRDAANRERIPADFNRRSELRIDLSEDQQEHSFDIP